MRKWGNPQNSSCRELLRVWLGSVDGLRSNLDALNRYLDDTSAIAKFGFVCATILKSVVFVSSITLRCSTAFENRIES